VPVILDGGMSGAAKAAQLKREHMAPDKAPRELLSEAR
jgi:hypothetical protein